MSLGCKAASISARVRDEAGWGSKGRQATAQELQ
jgi:hypothetical protein